jgi:23S rRNA (adenine2503-C2)-methyltransferase
MTAYRARAARPYENAVGARSARPHTNLYDLAPAQLQSTLGEVVSPPFRIKQIAEWMHRRGVESFDAMSNLPKDVRAKLEERFTLEFPHVVERTAPASDGSQKYLFVLGDGNRIESVYMPMRDRTSICLSSQAGCAVGCTFCVTGFFGANPCREMPQHLT